jgi:hypothetical protein
MPSLFGWTTNLKFRGRGPRFDSEQVLRGGQPSRARPSGQ